MRSITILTQRWFSDAEALPQLLDQLNQFTDRQTTIDIRDEYFAEELDDILSNRQSIADQKGTIIRYETAIKEGIEQLVDTLKELGLQPLTKINVDITTNEDFDITIKIWYNEDGTLGHEFYNELE